MTKKDGTDSYSKIEESNKRYLNSEKGKQAKRRYDLSDKGREARGRYLESEKGQAALLRYYLSEKGATTRQHHNEMTKLFIQLNKYLEENPNKTIEDFLSSLKGNPHD